MTLCSFICQFNLTPKTISTALKSLLSEGNFSLFDHSKDCLNSEGFVVIFMHDFNDHHFHSAVLQTLLPPIMNNLKITLQLIEDNQITYVLKLHPNVAYAPDMNESCCFKESPVLIASIP